MTPLPVELPPTLDPYQCPHASGLRKHSKGHDLQLCALVSEGSGIDGVHFCPLSRCAACPQEEGHYVKRVIAMALSGRIIRRWRVGVVGSYTLSVEDSLRRLKDREGVVVAEDALVGAVANGLPQAEADRLADTVLTDVTP